MKCDDHHTKKLIYVLLYNCLYQNKGNNSKVNASNLTKLIGYREFMVLIICTKNESNLTNTYRDMLPDRQKVWTDGRNGRTDEAKTISLRLRRGIIIDIFLIHKHLLGPSGLLKFSSFRLRFQHHPWGPADVNA